MGVHVREILVLFFLFHWLLLLLYAEGSFLPSLLFFAESLSLAHSSISLASVRWVNTGIRVRELDFVWFLWLCVMKGRVMRYACVWGDVCACNVCVCVCVCTCALKGVPHLYTQCTFVSEALTQRWQLILFIPSSLTGQTATLQRSGWHARLHSFMYPHHCFSASS